MIITRQAGIGGAARATGPTIVIDVFRAFSAAAYAFDAGAAQIVLASEVAEARDLAASIPGALLMGEVDGIRPDGFAFGNSPGEIQAEPDRFNGRTVVHRSSAGTRCARAALDNGATPVFVASLVVASATAHAVGSHEEVTIVASGLSGTSKADEDEICADVIAGLLLGGNVDLAAAADAVAGLERAQTLAAASFAHPEDVRLCCDADRFDFAMDATATGDGVVVRPIRVRDR